MNTPKMRGVRVPFTEEEDRQAKELVDQIMAFLGYDKAEMMEALAGIDDLDPEADWLQIELLEDAAALLHINLDTPPTLEEMFHHFCAGNVGIKRPFSERQELAGV